jgi:hypothetical protein
VAGSQTDTLLGGGVALATIGGVLMGVGASENSGSGHLIWGNPWFAAGCALVVCGAGLVLWMISPAVLRAVKRRKRVPTIREHVEQGIPFPPGLGRGLGALIPDPVLLAEPPPQPSPLQLKVVEDDWRLVGEMVWVIGLKVRMTNITDDPIEVSRYYLYTDDLDVDDTGATFPAVPDKMWDMIGKEERRLKAAHLQDDFWRDIVVLPLATVTEWFFGEAAVPVPERGRPWCKLRVKDTLGNAYHLTVPARPAKTYQS